MKSPPPGLPGSPPFGAREEVLERHVQEGPARLGEDLALEAEIAVDVDAPAAALGHPRGNLQVAVQAAGLAPGRYGAHIHAVGRCEGPDFESAGPHWNPGGRQHGAENPQGAHLGDLPNLAVDAEGHGRMEFSIPGATLRGGQPLLDADGAAIVIHAAPDDFRTDPAGNSGARILCGVIGVE